MNTGTASAPAAGNGKRPLIDGRDDTVINLADFAEICERKGFELAKAGGLILPKEREMALEAAAEAEVARSGAAEYIPGGNMADELMERRYQDARAQAEGLSEEVAHARSNKLQREKEMAAFGPPEPLPEKPVLIALFGGIAIALVLMMTLHDTFFQPLLGPGSTTTLAAFLASSVIGGALVTVILFRDYVEDRSFIMKLMPSIIAVGFGLSLFILRGGFGVPNWAFSLGLGALETVFVLMLEVTAISREQKTRKLMESQHEKEASARQLEAAKRHLEEREAALGVATGKVDDHIELVRTREHWRRTTEVLKKTARACVAAGYERGLADNRGLVKGATTRPPTQRELLARLERDYRQERNPLS